MKDYKAAYLKERKRSKKQRELLNVHIWCSCHKCKKIRSELSQIEDEIDFVSRWNDKLGSGHDLIQATATNQPKLMTSKRRKHHKS